MFRVNLGFYLVLCCVAHDFIELVYTAKWLPAVPAIRMFSIFAIVNPLVGMTRRAFLNTGISKPVGIAQIVLVAILLVTLIPLIKLFGLLGAAIAVNISIVACFVFMTSFLNKILDADFKQILIKPVFVALLIALIYLSTNQIFLPERTWLRLITHSAIIGGLYIGGIMLMERAYFVSLIKEIRRANA
jgi:O-antigen/teichoic acid export membrane protein